MHQLRPFQIIRSRVLYYSELAISLFVLNQAFDSQNFAENLGNEFAGSTFFHWCEKLMSVVDNMGLKSNWRLVSPKSDRQQSVDLLQLSEAHFCCIVYWSQWGSRVNLTPLIIICESKIIATVFDIIYCDIRPPGVHSWLLWGCLL